MGDVPDDSLTADEEQPEYQFEFEELGKWVPITHPSAVKQLNLLANRVEKAVKYDIGGFKYTVWRDKRAEVEGRDFVQQNRKTLKKRGIRIVKPVTKPDGPDFTLHDLLHTIVKSASSSSPTSWDPVISYVKSNPSSASTPDQQSLLPLHKACYFLAPQPVIKALLTPFITSLVYLDSEGRTPLHCALLNAKQKPATMETIVLLCTKDSAKLANKRGQTPLHNAITGKCDFATCMYIHNIYEGAADIEDANGHTPVHYALCNNDPDPKLVVSLLSSHPDFARRGLKLGSSSDNVMLPIAAYLVHFMKPGVQEDDKGLPMEPDIDIVNKLVECNEGSLYDVTYYPNRTPLEIARKLKRVKTEIIKRLENNDFDDSNAKYEHSISGCLESYVAFTDDHNEVIKNMVSQGATECEIRIEGNEKVGKVTMDRKTGVREYWYQEGGTTVKTIVRAKKSSGVVKKNPLHDLLLQIKENKSMAATHDESWSEVMTCIKDNPSYVSERCPSTSTDPDGSTVLELALSIRDAPRQPPVAVIEAICEAHPPLISTLGASKDYPLHLACSKGYSVDVVMSLHAHYPDAIKHKDAFGWIPMHYACGIGRAELPVIMFLYSSYQESLTAMDNEGRTPLFWAVQNLPETTTLAVIRMGPEAAKMSPLPIFCCLKRSSRNPKTFKVIKALFDSNPDCVYEFDTYNETYDTPYDCAMKMEEPKASNDILELLKVDTNNRHDFRPGNRVRAVKDSAFLEWRKEGMIGTVLAEGLTLQKFQVAWDGQDSSPFDCTDPSFDPRTILEKVEDSFNKLHSVLLSISKLDTDDKQRDKLWDDVIVDCVSNPSHAAQKCPSGYLMGSMPLNMALYLGKVPLAAVEALYAAHPPSISIADNSGDLPLHNAVYKQSSFDIISYLFPLFPKAIEHQDRNGWLPIHYACGHGRAGLPVLKFLVERYREGLTVQDNNGGTPLYWAVENQSEESILYVIENEPSVCAIEPWPLFHALLNAWNIVTKKFEIQVDDGMWVEANSVETSALFDCARGDPGDEAVRYTVKMGGSDVSKEYILNIVEDHSRSYDIDRVCVETGHRRKVRMPLWTSFQNIIRALVDADPSILKVRRHDEDTPYDIALKMRPPPTTVLLQLLKPLSPPPLISPPPVDDDPEDELPPLVPTPTHRSFTKWGGVVTTKVSGAQCYLPSNISPGSITVTEVDARHIQGAPNNVAGPVLTFDGNFNSQMKVRLPHNGGREITAWAQSQDGKWQQVKSKQIESITDSYATVNFSSVPKSATVTSSESQSTEIECSVQLWTGLKKYCLVVVENMASTKKQVADTMTSKAMKLVDEGSVFGSDLQLKFNDVVTVSTDAGDVKKKKWKKKPITIDFVRKADVFQTVLTVVGGEDEDEIELSLAFDELLPKTPPAPKVSLRNQVSLQLQVQQLAPGEEYVAGIVRLSLKHLVRANNSFPPASSFADEKWEEIQDSSAAEDKFSISPPPYACYVRLKVINSFGQSTWGEILFVQAERGKKGSTAAVSGSPSQNGRGLKKRSPSGQSNRERSVSDNADGEDPSPNDLMREIEDANRRSKLYCSSCDLIKRHTSKLVDHFVKFATNEKHEEIVVSALKDVRDLLNACSAPGWLALVIRPPTPSWVGKFQKTHLEVCMAGLKCGIESFASLDTEAYFKENKSDRLFLQREHFIKSLEESNWSLTALEGRDFAIDFECDRDVFIEEMRSSSMNEVVELLYKEWAKRQPVVGSPRGAIHSMKLRSDDTIYISSAACDNAHLGYLNHIANRLLKLGYGIRTSEEDLRGPNDVGVWSAIETAIDSSAAFLAIRTTNYGNREKAKQSSSELDFALRNRKQILNLGFDGEEWDVDFNGSLGGSTSDGDVFDDCMSRLEIKLHTFGVRPSDDARSDLSEGSGYQFMEMSSRSDVASILSERSNMSKNLHTWLEDNGWSHLEDQLVNAGVTNVREVCSLVRQDRNEDLKQLLMNETEANKFRKNVNKLHKQVFKEEFEQGAMEQVVAVGNIISNIPIVGGILGVIVTIVDEAKTLSEKLEERHLIEVKCGLARHYLEALPESDKWPRLKDKKKILEGVEKCILEIDNILQEVKGELAEFKRRQESKSTIMSKFKNFRHKFYLGIKERGLQGCLERFDQ
eukprot:CAMPEP_0118672262 /NCGR_PEP_ID=MMETSP0785-20121206/22444_1 /TAXON_ID=91992 /ORGANISM="Bolidomonas pacifica, Strain CCMP 1866" /LENGTH=2130 /DNA_ID=CAMNT_0006567207 /DNA_START=45 /DNA_END=6434 /DNA_ORIENTATION=-